MTADAIIMHHAGPPHARDNGGRSSYLVLFFRVSRFYGLSLIIFSAYMFFDLFWLHFPRDRNDPVATGAR